MNAIIIISLNLFILVSNVNGQSIRSPCTFSMVANFTQCLNFITGSTSGNGRRGGSPSPGCCSSVKSLMNTNIDCACLLITANVPIQIPVNRTLAINLPRACNMNIMPLQCKASTSPLPAPGPVELRPALSPTVASSPLTPTGHGNIGPTLSPSLQSSFGSSPKASKVSALAPAPGHETKAPLAAPQPSPRIRPVFPQQPTSSATFAYHVRPLILFITIGSIMVLKC